jgi:hypothetical protein
MLKRQDLVELSHMNEDMWLKSGCSNAQRQEITTIYYYCSEQIQCYMLDNLLKLNNWQQRLFTNEAQKLINNLRANRTFEFVEYNSTAWKIYKNKEQYESII